VHLTWTGRREQPGFPSVQRFRDLWTWVRDVMIPDGAEQADEGTLVDL
jgi:hypothetical protein